MAATTPGNCGMMRLVWRHATGCLEKYIRSDDGTVAPRKSGGGTVTVSSVRGAFYRATVVVGGADGRATTVTWMSRPRSPLRTWIVVAPGALPTTTTAALDCWLPR